MAHDLYLLCNENNAIIIKHQHKIRCINWYSVQIFAELAVSTAHPQPIKIQVTSNYGILHSKSNRGGNTKGSGKNWAEDAENDRILMLTYHHHKIWNYVTMLANIAIKLLHKCLGIFNLIGSVVVVVCNLGDCKVLLKHIFLFDNSWTWKSLPFTVCNGTLFDFLFSGLIFKISRRKITEL